LSRRFQVAPELLRITPTLQGIAVEPDDSLDRSPVFIQELDPQTPGTVGDQARKGLGRGLRRGVEQGVPAADIGLERMLGADPVGGREGDTPESPRRLGRLCRLDP
jgi:hypothetical protein